MTIKELINRLGKHEDNLEIIMSKDAEGNGFSPLADICLAEYVPGDRYSGEIRNEESQESNAIVLWPTN